MKNLILRLTGSGLNLLSLVAPRKTGDISLKLFCRPFRPSMTDKQRTFLEAAHAFTVDYKNNRVRAYQWGKGPVKILLIHGWQSHTYRWRRYIEALDPADYTIYAFDAPGHGLSDGSFLSVPLYSEVIEHFTQQLGGIDYIISHSLGAFSAMYTLFRLPEWKIKKLVVMGSPGNAREFIDFYQKTLGLWDRVIRLTVERFKAMFQNPPGFYSAPVFASSLTMDGLIIHDEGDLETPAENAIQVHKNWEKATLFITKGFGHNLKSSEVVKKVIHFIEKKEDHLISSDSRELKS